MNIMLGNFMQFFRSLSFQFLAAGGLVMAAAAYSVGTWVTDRIERGVVENSGIAAALFIESLIPNQSFSGNEELVVSDAARLALRKAFSEGILSERVVTYNIWSEQGEILDSYRIEQRGQKYGASDPLIKAWSGSVATQFLNLEIEADHPESILGVPLLEVYVPIRDADTGRVLAVVEFYQRAEGLAAELREARSESWMLTVRIFGLSGAVLFLIVHAGSRLIERQRAEVKAQLAQSQRLSQHNDALRARITQAAQRSTAQSEKIMQRIGHDLHDGVAQHLSLASLRLDSAGLGTSEDAVIVTEALSNAMTELRAISRGLALPDLATLSLNGCVAQAIRDHNKSFGSNAVLVTEAEGDVQVSYATKLCVYRFLQEALSNAYRHAKAKVIEVRVMIEENQVKLIVSDDGRGFELQSQSGLREDGGQGLLGLADRAATLNGQVDITTAPNVGTEIRLILPLTEEA